MSKLPNSDFLDVYVDNLLVDEEPTARPLTDLFAEANELIAQDESDGSVVIPEVAPNMPTISNDLFNDPGDTDKHSVSYGPESSTLTAKHQSANEVLAFADPKEGIAHELLSPLFENITNDDALHEINDTANLIPESSSEILLDTDMLADEGLTPESTSASTSPALAAAEPISRAPMFERLGKGSFQTLILEIAGVKLAVPLVELGGIHAYQPLQHIIGKPDWYAGFVQLKGKAVNCIDGAKWLLGDTPKYDPSNAEAYQYIVMLNDTNWGIACHNLVDTVLLFKDEVKWRDIDIKRPWKAGLLKKEMCALLDTYQITDMLDAGLSSAQR